MRLGLKMIETAVNQQSLTRLGQANSKPETAGRKNATTWLIALCLCKSEKSWKKGKCQQIFWDNNIKGAVFKGTEKVPRRATIWS